MIKKNINGVLIMIGKVLSFIFRKMRTALFKGNSPWVDCGYGVKIRLVSPFEIVERSKQLAKKNTRHEPSLLRKISKKLEDHTIETKWEDVQLEQTLSKDYFAVTSLQDDYLMAETSLNPSREIPLHFWDYDYIKNFEHNNSLRYGGIPLCIGPKQISIIEQTDAVYCQEEKCWFSPYKSNANINELYEFMPKVYHLGNESILVPNLVPEPLWGRNLRKYLSKRDWDFLRKYTYSISGYRCSICGGKGKQWPVECDEMWDYRSLEEGREVSVLVGLRALCPRCHRVNHLGKAKIDGKYDETIRHMAYINGWSLNYSEHVAEEAFKLFNERSEKSWLMGYDNECPWDPSVEKILKTFFCVESPP